MKCYVQSKAFYRWLKKIIFIHYLYKNGHRQRLKKSPLQHVSSGFFRTTQPEILLPDYFPLGHVSEKCWKEERFSEKKLQSVFVSVYDYDTIIRPVSSCTVTKWAAGCGYGDNLCVPDSNIPCDSDTVSITEMTWQLWEIILKF